MRPLQLSVPAVAALIALTAVPADAGTPDSRGAAPVEVSVITDPPYGDAQRLRLPGSTGSR